MFKKNFLKLSALLLVLIFVFTSIGAVYANNPTPADPGSNTPTDTDNQSSVPGDPFYQGIDTPLEEEYKECVQKVYDDNESNYDNCQQYYPGDLTKFNECENKIEAKEKQEINAKCYDLYLQAEKESQELIIDKQFKVSEYLRVSKDTQTYLDNTENKGIVYFIVRFIEILTRIIGSFALLVMIAGGITILISSGNQNLQQAGKRMILYSVIGLVIAFLSVFIVSFVQSIFYTT